MTLTEPQFEALPYGRPVRRRPAIPLLALLAAGLVGFWVVAHQDVRYYTVASGSMEPTLSVGQRITVDTEARTPRIGDIIAFHAPAGAKPAVPVCGADGQGAGTRTPCGEPTVEMSRSVFIKRVVAVGGDTVAVQDGEAVVNGTPEPESPVADCADASRCTFTTPVRIPAGDLFLLGDNRGRSDDSRFWGPIPVSSVIGTVVGCSVLNTLCHPVP